MKEVWAVDFEFGRGPNGRPDIRCMAARELRGGREIKLWEDKLRALRRAPFNVGSDSTVIVFSAHAEISCFLELKWPLPLNVCDLYAENIADINGKDLSWFKKQGGKPRALVGALSLRGQTHISADEKPEMRALALRGGSYSEAERVALLDYCMSDADALDALLKVLRVDWPRALFRGRAMVAHARVELAGIPVDVELIERLRASAEPLLRTLIEDVDRDFGVFDPDGKRISRSRFARYLNRAGIPWPHQTRTGELSLDKDAFKERATLYPQLQPLRELHRTIGVLNFSELDVGEDGRARCFPWPFATITGRNAPSSSAFIFGAPRWARSLIREVEGRAIAYLDFVTQEFAVGAALSGDARMAADYAGGDVYMNFAKSVRLVPPDAVREDYENVRERCKQILLGIGYGMGPSSIAKRAEIWRGEAREILEAHYRAYEVFWNWVERSTTTALMRKRITTGLGWPMHVGPGANYRSLQNWPIQAAGANIMQLTTIAATELGIELVATVHDGFLISAPDDEIEAQARAMADVMQRAALAVTKTVAIRVDTKIIRHPSATSTSAAPPRCLLPSCDCWKGSRPPPRSRGARKWKSIRSTISRTSRSTRYRRRGTSANGSSS